MFRVTDFLNVLKLGEKWEAKNFALWLSGQSQLADSTIKSYSDCINLFIKKNGEFNKESISIFLKNHPRKKYKTALNHYFRYKGWNYKLPKIKVPEKEIHDVPSRETLNNIIIKLEVLKEKNEEGYWVFSLLFNTGARIHEILKLRMKDIDFGDGKIRFRTKGGKYKEIKIRREIIDDLEKFFVGKKGLLSNERLFFRHTKNNHIAYVSFRRLIYNSDLNEKEKRFVLRTDNFRKVIVPECRS